MIFPMLGMSTDLSHISTATKVTGHSGEGQLGDCLKDCDIVVIPAGVPRKPGMARDDLFNVNAMIVKNLAVACAKYCPEAHVMVISNPVNSTVPITVEVMKRMGVKSPRVYGITTLDIVRAKTFVGELKNVDPAKVKVQVIGGHSGPTIIPLLSNIGDIKLSADEIKSLTQRIQYGGDEVVKAKAGTGSATLSMAFAAREFVAPFIKALNGDKTTLTCYMEDSTWKGLNYFAGDVVISSAGKEKVLPLPKLSEYEQELYEKALPELKSNIEKGIEFSNKSTL